MEVLIDLLIALSKILVHLLEPAIMLMAGFWRWWKSELPEVLVFEEDKQPQLEEPMSTRDKILMFVVGFQITLFIYLIA